MWRGGERCGGGGACIIFVGHKGFGVNKAQRREIEEEMRKMKGTCCVPWMEGKEKNVLSTRKCYYFSPMASEELKDRDDTFPSSFPLLINLLTKALRKLILWVKSGFHVCIYQVLSANFSVSFVYLLSGISLMRQRSISVRQRFD